MTNGYTTPENAKNVEYKLSADGKILHLRIELEAEPYGEGEKTYKIATTSGNKIIEGADKAIRFGVNVFKYKPRD